MGYLQEVAQNASTAGVTSLVLTIPGGVTVPAGHTVVVFEGAHTAASRLLSTVVDSQSNTYTVNAPSSVIATHTAIGKAFLTTQLTAGDTITLTWNGATLSCAAIALEFSGPTNAAVDKVISGGSTTAQSSMTTNTSATTAQAIEILVAHVFSKWGSTVPSDDLTPDSPWIELPMAATSGSSSIHCSVHPMWQSVSSTGTYTASATTTGSHIWRMSGATLRAVAVALGRSFAAIFG